MYQTGWREAGGLIFWALAILVSLSLASFTPGDVSFLQEPPNIPAQNFVGPVGAWIGLVLFMAFGLGAWLVPPLLGLCGFVLLFQQRGRLALKGLWGLLGLVGVSIFLELYAEGAAEWSQKVNAPGAGGILGVVLGQQLLARWLGRPGTTVLAVAVFLAALTLTLDLHPLRLLAFAYGGLRRALAMLKSWIAEIRMARAAAREEERERERRRKRLEEAMREAAARRAEAPKPAEAVASVKVSKPPPPKPAAPEPAPAAPARTDLTLPPLDLLDPIPSNGEREIKADHREGAEILKETLAEFGIEVDVTHVERGPVVTRYEVLPAPGVRVEKIVSLSNNIALAMKAESVRIQAPIPGKGVVGIEVPNSKTTLVCLREILESSAWRNTTAALPLALGKDVGGRELIADLAEMPHLLIAGATGSGKTVCMNSLLAGLLMSRTPEQLRLLLVDPKIVEFSVYQHLPHLVVPVITDAKKVGLALRWAISEMEKRYKLFARVGVRNIQGFNQRSRGRQGELFATEPAETESEPVPERLPYIVIVVDELADLMLVAQAEIEMSIARLAQLSRAVGIHMILATQRPSVNVITGTIKANFPARLSFQVAQKVDSRTILDAAGADKLLGRGDMLFLPPGVSKLIRAQGTFTSDGEIKRITDYWRQRSAPRYEMVIREKLEADESELPDLEEDEALLQQAIEVLRQTRRASTSTLQRRLRIGYTRAARLMDLLEERGIVGPPNGSDPREILVDLDGDISNLLSGGGA